MKFKDLIDFIQSGECSFKFGWIDKNTYGLLYRDTDVIFINYHLLMAETILHEILHHTTGSDDERKINRQTNRLMKRLTVDEIKKVVLEALMEGDEV